MLPQASTTNHEPFRVGPPRWLVATAAVVGLIVVVGVWWVGWAGGPLAALLPAAGSPASTDQPRLAVDRDLIDLGVQPFERQVSAVFEVRNVGGSTLQILEEPAVEVVEGC